MLFLSQKIIFDTPALNFSFAGDINKHRFLPPHKSLLCTDKNKGLPIGNLTSQFYANVYLDMLDNYIKRVLKIRYYVRYVDDFVFFGDNKNELLEKKSKIEEFLKDNLKLGLRPSFRLRATKSGIDFLGYIIRPHYLLVRNRVVNNFKSKRYNFLKYAFKYSNSCSLENAKKYKAINASYYGHFKHANSYNLIKKYEMENWR